MAKRFIINSTNCLFRTFYNISLPLSLRIHDIAFGIDKFFGVLQRPITIYPVIRGMVSYGTIWPTGCFIQQIVAGDEQFDYYRAARFSLFGCFYVAPTINVWLTIAKTIWPKNDMKSAITKAVVEQVSYTPFAMVSFYFGMSLLEGKTVNAATEEVRKKFLPTYQVGAVIWPLLQTFNYTVVPERNRIPFVSLCSLMWSSFLAYMNRKESVADNLHATVH